MPEPPDSLDSEDVAADDEPPGETGDLEETGELVDAEHVADNPDRRLQYAARFRGPLPHPAVLRQYEEVMPGLPREIVDQWKGETGHRHKTIDGMRATDHEAMRQFYKAELRGQVIAAVIFIGVLAVAVVAILEHEQWVGISAIVAAGGSAIWSMRRRSTGPSEPSTDLGNGDELEKSES